jgi:type III pantothenate kinase
MQHTLCFDFGNTLLKCAVFEGADFKEVVVVENDSTGTIENLLQKYQPTKSILSSVIDHHPGIEEFLKQRTTFHKLSHESKLPITTPVGKPETIGADRLAMVVGAIDLYPKKHNLVIG